MTSELRPERTVFWAAKTAAWKNRTPHPEKPHASIGDMEAAADVIEAYGNEREAKGRADQAAEIARLSEALAAIADGEGDAQDIARQTLAGEEDQ